MIKNFELNGKTAVVTGGAGLLGTQHVCALMEIGANVILADLDLDKAQTQSKSLNGLGLPGRCKALQMDVTDETQIRRTMNEAANFFGQVDILVNNAAIDPKVKSTELVNASRLENFSIEDWNFQIGVGLSGAFLCCKVFGTEMAKHGAGVILNISSDLSVIAPDQRLYYDSAKGKHLQPVKPITYSVIKTGLIGMTRYLSTYWHEYGVRVNALSPGGVKHDQDSDFIKRVESRIPLRRLANKDEYRSAVQFLCSDASSYMTGQNLIIDGGRSAW